MWAWTAPPMDSSGRRSTKPGHSLRTVLVKGPRSWPKDDRGGQARENPIALTTPTIRKRAITRNLDHAWPVAGQRRPDLHPCAVAGQPAIDKAKNLNGYLTDQRGFPRTVDRPCIA